MKSCWRYSRMPHDSLTRLRGEQPWPPQTYPLPAQGVWRCRQLRNRQMAGLPDGRLAVDSLHSSAFHTGIFNIVLRRTERLSIYHRRVPLHTQRSALSSKLMERPIAPLPMLTRAPYQMSLFVFADLWLRAIESDCPPAFLGIVTAGFALTHTIGKPDCTSK